MSLTRYPRRGNETESDEGEASRDQGSSVAELLRQNDGRKNQNVLDPLMRSHRLEERPDPTHRLFLNKQISNTNLRSDR